MSKIQSSGKEPIAVIIVTGFLGSGKTTFVNYILQKKTDLKVAVLVNEFGDIGIDQELILSKDEQIVELNNGCICCNLNQDLALAVERILNYQFPVDYLIVETTGIADPIPVALTFLGDKFRDQTRLDAIITMADCENFSLEFLANNQAVMSQFVSADMVLLNKIDLVSSEIVDKIVSEIKGIKPSVTVIKTVNSIVSLPLIFPIFMRSRDETLKFFAGHDHHDHHDHLDDHGFMSFSWRCDRPISRDNFENFLRNNLPSNIVRAKGFLWVKEQEFRQIFHLIGKRFYITNDLGKAITENQIVFIGQNLDQDQLRSLLEQCIADI
jgi:G3E family GTPase